MLNNEYIIDTEKNFSEENHIPDFDFMNELVENVENAERVKALLEMG